MGSVPLRIVRRPITGWQGVRRFTRGVEEASVAHRLVNVDLPSSGQNPYERSHDCSRREQPVVRGKGYRATAD